MTKHDVVVIGSGPGGYTAAIRAAQLGKNVAIIEKDEALGGVCLNWGCIPTKALLKSAEVYHCLKNAGVFGINIADLSFDFQKVIERSRQVVAKLCAGIEYLMQKNGITVYRDYAILSDRSNGKSNILLKNNNTQITTEKLIIATGSRARNLPNIEVDGHLIWDAKAAMLPNSLPKSLLIIGSGAIGIEFASFYNAFGVEVTVLEIQDRILVTEDLEISTLAKTIFSKQGIVIHNNASIKKFTKGHDNVQVTISKKAKGQEKEFNAQFDRVILAVGVLPNTENIGLENTKIQINKSGFIITDEWSETAESGIYAIGDVAGAPCLAHKASHQGVICVEKMFGKSVHSLKDIPGCIYSHPQIASIGMTELQAKEQGYDIKVGRFNAVANGKAIALDETDGLVKVIFDKKTGELLGAHMIGAEVTEMINGYAIAKSLEATDLDLRNVVFPHPTLSEMMHEAVLSADNESLNS